MKERYGDQLDSAANKRNKKFTRTGMAKMGREKDELDYAVSWRRAFLSIFTQLKWLDDFSQINQVAIEKIVEKF